MLKVFNCDTMQQEKQIQLSSYARSIDMKNGKILLGLRDGIIQCIEGEKTNTIINGHSTGETWGLAVDETTGLVTATPILSSLSCMSTPASGTSRCMSLAP